MSCWFSIRRGGIRQNVAHPASITLEPLPPRSPELNPVERVWLFLKEKFLSHRLLDDYDAILDAAAVPPATPASAADRMKMASL